ncbi:MAG: DNA polymerase III subunit delta [Pyrinomonadaceae bacterium]
MTATRSDLDRSLREGGIAPLYLLVGDETYLRNAAANAITDAALSDTLLREFNQTSFSLLSQSAQEAIAAAEQLPMMSSRRVVRISNFGKLREADEDPLIRYVNRPAESSVVIFLAADLDKRKKLTKALLDNCVVIDFPPMKDGEAKAWAKTRLKELKIGADEQALSELISLVGTDVQTLFSELDKLAAAAGDSKRITLDTVASLVSRSRELSNFELGDQILARNRKRALETLHRLLEGGSQPVMLIGLIASNYHKLALAKDLLNRGSREDVFRVIPLPQFKRNDFINNLQRIDASRIAQGIQLIAAADLAIKTSQATPRLQLELLVCELAA